MNELSWEQIEFSNEFFSKENTIDITKGTIKRAYVGLITVLAILSGMIIVSYTAITMYTTYRETEVMKQALQMAKDQNRQIDIATDNRYTFVVNVGNHSSLDLSGSSAQAIRVTVYPRNHMSEYIKLPNGQTITP